VIGFFGQISKKTLRQTRLLGCERPYLQMAFRGLLIRTGSGTADVMSVAFVAAEVTGDQVALRVASAGKTRVSSGEIWTAKSAFSVGRPSVDFWFGALGNRSVSPCLGPKPHLRSPTFGPEIRNSSSSVRRQFGGNSGDSQPKARIGEESRCDVQTMEGLLSWCLGERLPPTLRGHKP
jgi:hypothetical protein